MFAPRTQHDMLTDAVSPPVYQGFYARVIRYVYCTKTRRQEGSILQTTNDDVYSGWDMLFQGACCLCK